MMAIVIFLTSCGLYMGAEGVKYNSEEMEGFITPTVKKQIDEDRKGAYEQGKQFEKLRAEAEKKGEVIVDKGPSKEVKLVDTSTTFITGGQIEGSVVSAANLIPGAGTIIGYLLMYGFGIARRRKDV